MTDFIARMKEKYGFEAKYSTSAAGSGALRESDPENFDNGKHQGHRRAA
jgi:hypothetical protein